MTFQMPNLFLIILRNNFLQTDAQNICQFANSTFFYQNVEKLALTKKDRATDS